MDTDVEGKIGPGHSTGQLDKFVRDTLRVGSIRTVVRRETVSNCLGVCLHQRMTQSVREV